MPPPPRPFSPVALVALLCLLFGMSGCDRGGQRALVIGLDGASLRVTESLMREGRLPNLQRIAERGVSGRLRSFQPLVSPRIWASIATGKVPVRHGIAAFVRPGDETDENLYLSSDRRVPAVWNILSEAGRSIVVVSWWTTYPPERIKGVMISDHTTAPMLTSDDLARWRTTTPEKAPLVYPSDLQARMLGLLVDAPPVTDAVNPFVNEAAPLPRWVERSDLARMLRKDNATTHAALTLEAEFRPDLLMVYLSAIDHISHRLWGTLEPEELYPTSLRAVGAARAGGAESLRQTYVFLDALIGALVARYARDDLVMVISDHGFEGGVGRYVNVTGMHLSINARDGLIFAKGRGIPAGERARKLTVNDITPTILAWFGLPIGRDMDGRIAPFLDVVLREPVPSYDGTPIQRLTLNRSGVESTIVDQLRALGYLE